MPKAIFGGLIAFFQTLVGGSSAEAAPDVSSNKSRQKKFCLTADQIKLLAPGYGDCIASDLITVAGKKVAFMYRDPPSFDEDSGWVFLSGFESDDYMDDPNNHEVYDVNSIANYDPDIIPYLDAPFGTAFRRENKTGPFLKDDNFEPQPE
jgi:hypothetical protein